MAIYKTRDTDATGSWGTGPGQISPPGREGATLPTPRSQTLASAL